MRRRFAVAALLAAALSASANAQVADWFPARFRESAAGLELWQWIAAAGGLGASIAAYVLAFVLLSAVARFRIRLQGPNARPAKAARQAASFVAALLAWSFLEPLLELPSHIDRGVGLIVQVLGIIATLVFVLRVWDLVCDTIAADVAGQNRRAEKLLIPVTRKLVRFLLVIGALLVALAVVGVNVTGVLAGLGLGGLVVALAAKDSVENIFGSITILFDMPFALGDWVKIGTAEGVVEEINLRSTRIRTFEDSVITLPNSNLIKASVENFGARRFRRQKFQVRLNYASDPGAIQAFCNAIRDYLNSAPGVLPDRTFVELNALDEPSLGVLVQAFFESETYGDELRMRHDLLMEILKAAETTDVRLAAAPAPVPPT